MRKTNRLSQVLTRSMDKRLKEMEKKMAEKVKWDIGVRDVSVLT